MKKQEIMTSYDTEQAIYVAEKLKSVSKVAIGLNNNVDGTYSITCDKANQQYFILLCGIAQGIKLERYGE